MGINKAANDVPASLLDLIYKSGLPPCEAQREIAAVAAKTQPGEKNTADSGRNSDIAYRK
ncbi:MAG: hypothetical protein IJD21_00300 [Oscillospiraceae bacterium]|nr:hypothetical protein [Oscillospiraceae bacterium]